MLASMLRPSNSLLGSSRAARRANVRHERRKALGRAAGAGFGAIGEVWGTVVDLVLLFGMPVVYLASSYLALDLPLRWMSGRESPDWVSGLLVAGAWIVALVGVGRVLRDAEPLAPVRPRFAKVMLALSWVAGLLFTISDLTS